VAPAALALGVLTRARELKIRGKIKTFVSQDILDFDFKTTFTHNPNLDFFLSESLSIIFGEGNQSSQLILGEFE
jgi:hypothetical protein